MYLAKMRMRDIHNLYLIRVLLLGSAIAHRFTNKIVQIIFFKDVTFKMAQIYIKFAINNKLFVETVVHELSLKETPTVPSTRSNHMNFTNTIAKKKKKTHTHLCVSTNRVNLFFRYSESTNRSELQP